MNTPILFVAFSHSLTQSQIDGFENQYCKYELTEDGNIREGSYYGTKIVTLADVAPELQKQMSNIPANATLEEIQELGSKIVGQAVKAGATHFFCTGEPTLTMWANLYANETPVIKDTNGNFVARNGRTTLQLAEAGHIYMSSYQMICIQSTTERRSVEVTNPDGTVTKTQIFQHVQWREMF